jgi:hypothetical protein
MSPHSRRALRPRLCTLDPRKARAQGRPGARCTRGLVCKIVQRNAHEHTGSAEAIRPSLRSGFTAYFVLSPATNSSCHRRERIKADRTRLGRLLLRALSTSNGCQDHTTSPSAISAVRRSRRQRCSRGLTRRPALQGAVARRRHCVHRIPAHVRDDRDTPLWGRDGGFIRLISDKPKRFIFRARAGQVFAAAS